MQFQVVVLATDGQVSRMSVECPSIQAARETLRGTGRIVSIEPKRDKFSVNVLASLEKYSARLTSHFLQVNDRDASRLLQSLAELLESKIPLAEAILELISSGGSKRTRGSLAALHRQICAGSNASTALHTVTNNQTALQLIALGEHSGKLSSALRKAAEHLRQQTQIRNQILSALAYPTIVAVAALSVAAYLVTTALPEISGILAAADREMPPMTKSLISLSEWFVDSYQTLIPALAFIAALAYFVCRVPKVRLHVHRCILKTPVIGQVLRMRETQRYAASLASLLGSGMPLQRAIENSANAVGNAHIRQCAETIASAVNQGIAAGSTIDEQHCFAFPFPSLIRIGERSGNIREAAVNAAVTLEQTLLESLKQAIRVIEPVLIISVGSIVGYVYIAFVLALMTASGGLN